MLVLSRRTVLVPLGSALLALGCRDALGLQDLRFEERPEPESVPVELPLGTGGLTLPVAPAAPVELEFPRTIEPGLTLFGSSSHRAGALFVGLSSDRRRLVEFFDANGALGDRALDLPGMATYALQFDTTTGTEVAAYATMDGLFWMFDATSEAPRTSAGSPGWTTLALGPPDSTLRLLAYDSTSGQFRLGAADFLASTESPLLGTLPTGFAIVSLVDGSTALLFSPETQNWELWALSEEPERIAGGSFLGTHLFSVHAPTGSRMLGYDAETGRIARYAIDARDVSTLQEEESSTWPRALDSFAPHAASGTVFVYNSATGVVDRRALNPLVGGPVVIK